MIVEDAGFVEPPWSQGYRQEAGCWCAAVRVVRQISSKWARNSTEPKRMRESIDLIGQGFLYNIQALVECWVKKTRTENKHITINVDTDVANAHQNMLPGEDRNPTVCRHWHNEVARRSDHSQGEVGRN